MAQTETSADTLTAGLRFTFMIDAVKTDLFLFTWSPPQRRHSSRAVHPVPLHTTPLWQSLSLPETEPLLPSSHQPAHKEKQSQLEWHSVECIPLPRPFDSVKPNPTSKVQYIRIGLFEVIPTNTACMSAEFLYILLIILVHL